MSRAGYQEVQDPLEWRKEIQRETVSYAIVLSAWISSSSSSNPRISNESICSVQIVMKLLRFLENRKE